MSDDMLADFIEQKLPRHEQARVLRTLRADPALAARVCARCHVMQLERHLRDLNGVPLKRWGGAWCAWGTRFCPCRTLSRCD